MIHAAHSIIYAEDAEATRAFFRDVLGLPAIDSGGGWLIFQLPPSELGIHPTGPGAAPSGTHQLYLMCDDIHATVAELASKGVEFDGDVIDPGFGLLITMNVPGGGQIGLYEPKHATAHDLPR